MSLDGQTTAPLNSTATAVEVQTALAALSNIGSGNVSVSGSGTTADPYLITFQGALAGVNLAPLTADNTSLVANHAPVILGANPLPTLEPNPANNSGAPVSTLIAGQATDADGDPLGIAVTAVNDTHGTWNYELAGGTSWTSIGNVSQTAELLLPPDASVQFVPAPAGQARRASPSGRGTRPAARRATSSRLPLLAATRPTACPRSRLALRWARTWCLSAL